jgi:hypothetical protein
LEKAICRQWTLWTSFEENLFSLIYFTIQWIVSRRIEMVQSQIYDTQYNAWQYSTYSQSNTWLLYYNIPLSCYFYLSNFHKKTSQNLVATSSWIIHWLMLPFEFKHFYIRPRYSWILYSWNESIRKIRRISWVHRIYILKGIRIVWT